MNKSQLIKKLSEECSLSVDDADLYVNKFFDSIKTALQNENRVEIRGFGSFQIRKYKSYKGRNPKTGEKIEVCPKKLPFFKCGLELRKIVNDK